MIPVAWFAQVVQVADSLSWAAAVASAAGWLWRWALVRVVSRVGQTGEEVK